MIISTSRRTDIPAFYSDWFINRIKEKYCYKVNPFNAKQIVKISLTPEDVDAFVFWSKNPQPIIKHLSFLDKEGYNYYFQFTLNNYSKLFEPNVPALTDRINTFQELSDLIGSEKVIWRYDPIIMSEITKREFHLENVEMIAEKLKGYTKRLVISFLDFYGKVGPRIKKLEEQNKFKVYDFTDIQYADALYDFASKAAVIAQKNNLEIFTCAENVDLEKAGIKKGYCVDGDLINKLFGLNNLYKKDNNQRKECLCVQSVDIGQYNCCSFQCEYCYANYSAKTILKNHEKHDVNSPLLIGKPEVSFVDTLF